MSIVKTKINFDITLMSIFSTLYVSLKLIHLTYYNIVFYTFISDFQLIQVVFNMKQLIVHVSFEY